MIRNLALSVLAVLTFSGAAHAGQEAWGGGVLVAVDSASRTVTVKQGEHEQRYRLAEDARVQDGKATLDVAQLDKGIGRYVTIRYAVDGDARVAQRVKVLDRKASVAVAGTPSAAEKTTP